MGATPQGMGAGRSLILFSLILLLFPFPISTFAQTEGLERGLNLTEDQKLKIQEIERRYAVSLGRLREELIKRRIEMERLRQEPTSAGRMSRLEEEIEDLKLRRDKLLRAMRKEIRDTLTEEQLKAWEEFSKGPRRRGWRNER